MKVLKGHTAVVVIVEMLRKSFRVRMSFVEMVVLDEDKLKPILINLS
jgi:hypothetical protein